MLPNYLEFYGDKIIIFLLQYSPCFIAFFRSIITQIDYIYVLV